MGRKCSIRISEKQRETGRTEGNRRVNRKFTFGEAKNSKTVVNEKKSPEIWAYKVENSFGKMC